MGWTKPVLRFCGKYIFGALFWVYLAAGMCIGAMSLATPLITGAVVNQLANTGSIQMDSVVFLCALLVFFQAGQAVLSYLSELIYVDLQSHAGYRLNIETLEHVKRLPQSFFVHFDSAYFTQQINHDANDLVIFIISSVVQVVSNAVTLIAIFVILMTLNIRLALVCAVLTVMGGALYLVFRRSLFKKSFDMQEKTARFFSVLQDQLDKVAFLRRHVLFERFREKLSNAFAEMYPALLANQKVTARFTLSNSIVRSTAQGLLLIVGAAEVIAGRLLPGYLVTVVGYYASLSSAIQFFLTWGKEYQASRVCYERLRRIWDISEEANGGICLEDVNTITCDHVGLSYPGSEGQICLDEKICFQKGRLYGIAGANGIGKSTLLEIILGTFPDDTNGLICYDGVAQPEINRYMLRAKCIGVTEQEPPILEDTLEANLTLLASDVDAAELEMYIDVFGLRDLVSTAPGGLETVLDERRQSISGGEKQKIAIIRLLMKNPSVMLLDEPTSALDADSRKELIRILRAKRSNHIIIVVTHDDGMLEACDEVIDLNRKEINRQSG